MGDLPDFQTKVSTGDDDVLFQGNIAAGASLLSMDVNAYGSIQWDVFNAVRTGPMNMSALWLNTTGQQMATDVLTAYPAPTSVLFPGAIVPVRSPRVIISNNGPDDQAIVVLGSKRTVPKMVGVGYSDHLSFINAAVAMVAGTFYDMSTFPWVQSQGLHQLEFALSNPAVTGGLYLAYDNSASSAVNTLIADSVEGVTDNGARLVSKQVILPASLTKLRFLCRTAGNASLAANLISVGL